MKKHKTKIIAAAVIIAVLIGVWFFEGGFPAGAPGDTHAMAAQEMAQEPESTNQTPPLAPPSEQTTAGQSTDPAPMEATSPEIPAVKDSPAQTPLAEEPPEETYLAEPHTNAVGSAETAPATEPPPDGPATPESEPPPPAPAEEERPAPTEPQNVTIGDDSFTVYLTVRVDNILLNMDRLCVEKHELVPADGIIFPLTAVIAYEGESVFNVLQREMRRARIHMESRFTPIFNSAYIMGINNLYEFDVGELSGWMYKVNGWFPNFGSSRYMLSPGDVIEWHYTVDLGRDLGEFWLGGSQRDD